MRHLDRAALREQLRHAQAVRIAGATGDDWPREQDRLRDLAGD